MMDPDELRRLNRYTASKVKIRKESKRIALDSWKPKVDEIIRKVTTYDKRFKFHDFPTGSFYDRLKVKEPDEFDLMMIMDELELDSSPYGDEDDGLQSEPPTGYTTVMIDQGEERIWQREGCVNRHGLLSAVQLKSLFARHVSRAITELGYQRFISQSSQGPAVTLKIKQHGKTYSIDMALAIKDSSWPDDAEEWRKRTRHGWPNQTLVNTIHRDGCFLVAKQPKDYERVDKPFLWYYSFTHAEKKLFREGSHGEASSCRKDVLRIMKALRENLQLTPLKSYYLKTIMLYECEDKPHAHQWAFDQLANRFQDAMKRLLQCLRQKSCPHYFMKELNLFKRMSSQNSQELAGRVQQILQNPSRYIVP